MSLAGAIVCRAASACRSLAIPSRSARLFRGRMLAGSHACDYTAVHSLKIASSQMEGIAMHDIRVSISGLSPERAYARLMALSTLLPVSEGRRAREAARRLLAAGGDA